MFKSNGGFTLVELIIVVAVLAILAAITIPNYADVVSSAETKVGQYQSAINAEATEISDLVEEYLNP